MSRRPEGPDRSRLASSTVTASRWPQAGPATYGRTTTAVAASAEDGPVVPAAPSIAEDLDRLLAQVETLPSQRPVVAQVLATVDDPDTSASQLGERIGNDAALAARLMRLANSAFYGLSGRVQTLQMAVTVVGFSAVRALAVASVVDTDGTPPEWLALSSLHGVAAGHVATILGVAQADAFCAGLLADLARPLLLGVSDGAYAGVCSSALHPDDLPEREVVWCGKSHQALGSEIFRAWHFPARLVGAAASHHEQLRDGADLLTVAVRAGHEIACRLMGNPARLDLRRITGGRIGDEDISRLAEDTRRQAADLQFILG